MKKSSRSGKEGRRPYIGIYFRCCGVYQRIYKKSGQESYKGFCPHCLRKVVVPVSPHGTEERIFEAE